MTKYFAVIRGAIGRDALNICSRYIDLEDIYDCNSPDAQFNSFCLRLLQLKSEGHNIFLLNLWGNKIFSKQVVNSLTSSLNLHPGLLPSQAGSHTITKALLENSICGASINQLSLELDKGNIYCQCCPITANKTMSGHELREYIAESLIDMLKTNAAWILNPKFAKLAYPGENGMYVNTKKSFIDSCREKNIEDFGSAHELFLWILAHDFSPDASVGRIVYTTRDGKKEIISFQRSLC